MSVHRVLRFVFVLAAMAVIAAGCSEEVPAGEPVESGPVYDALAVADLTGVEVEMRHEPG